MWFRVHLTSSGQGVKYRVLLVQQQSVGNTLTHTERNLTMQAIVDCAFFRGVARERDEKEIQFLLALVTFLHCKTLQPGGARSPLAHDKTVLQQSLLLLLLLCCT